MSDKSENDTGVELTHNAGMKYRKFDSMANIMAYMDQSLYDNVPMADGNDTGDVMTPTNKSALQRRYTIKKPPIPRPSKKVKAVPWVKLSDDTISKYKKLLYVSLIYIVLQHLPTSRHYSGDTS